LEVTGVELTGEKKKIVIIALYKSPSGNLEEFFITLTGILEQLVQKDQYIIIAGDFNINIQDKGCGHKKLLLLLMLTIRL
jgi:exonuclease III